MLKKSLILATTLTLINASTVMCYKKDHNDPATIESIPLVGEVCDEKYSVKDMKKNGYIIEDIELSHASESSVDYIYVFRKTQDKIENISNVDLRDQMKQVNLEDKRVKEDLALKESLENGRRVYEKTCKSCHGDGTISAYNTARPLVELSVDDIEESINAYSMDEKDNGMAIIMKPYANSLGNIKLKDVSLYIQTLKK